MNALLLESTIADLVVRFQPTSLHFFSERELHAEFYAIGRARFGSAKPKDFDIEVPLFRHEYNTMWRYRRASHGESFRGRSTDDGTAGALDFAILNRTFVESFDLLTVINKDEQRRIQIRRRDATLPRLDAAIEFKMAHVRDSPLVREAAVNQLRRGVREDCRKLAHEDPQRAYMLAFSHAQGPTSENAAGILHSGADEFLQICSRSLCLLLATPTTTYLHGPWERPDIFPHVQPI